MGARPHGLHEPRPAPRGQSASEHRDDRSPPAQSGPFDTDPAAGGVVTRPSKPAPANSFPLWGVLALPGGAIFGALIGIFVGALFGIPGIGVAIGAGLGVGIGLALLAAAIVLASAEL